MTLACCDHITATMPATCPACGAGLDPLSHHHEPDRRFFACGCSYLRLAGGGFGHYHACGHAYAAAVAAREELAVAKELLRMRTKFDVLHCSEAELSRLVFGSP